MERGPFLNIGKGFLVLMASPRTTAQLEQILRKNGFSSFKKATNTRLAVLVDGSQQSRVNALNKIAEVLGGKYSPDYRTPIVQGRGGSVVSSIGVVEVDDKLVFVKPRSSQGNQSAGIGNEMSFVNSINQYLEQGKGGAFYNISLELYDSSGKKFIIREVFYAVSAGSDTAGRKKSDVNLITSGGTIPLSLKKGNAEYWESADTLWGKNASVVLEHLNSTGIVKTKISSAGLTFFENGVSGVAIEASQQEKINFVFGSDLLGTGAIVKKTFNPGDFSFDEKLLHLKIRCDHVYTTLQELESSNEDVYLLIRRDSTRKSIPNYPGLRVLATYKSRVSGGVKKVDRTLLSGII